MAEQAYKEERTVEIDGQIYTVRRLSVKDIFPVARLLGLAIANGGTAIDFNDLKPTDVMSMVVAAIPYAESDVIKLFGSFIGVSPAEFADMPPTALLDVGEIIAEGDDLKAFFARCAKVANNLQTPAQEIKKVRSRARSTESSNDTDGVTTRS